MLDIGIVIPELAKYGGAERLLLECVNRWQHIHEITLYSTKFNETLLLEHGITEEVRKVHLSPYFDVPHSTVLNCVLLPKVWERQIGRHDVYHTHLWPMHLIDVHPVVWYPHEPLRVLHDLRHEESLDGFVNAVRNIHIYPKGNYDGVMDAYRDACLTSMDMFDKLGRPDRIVANSRYSARYLEDVYGRKVDDVVYPGANVRDFITTGCDSTVGEGLGRVYDRAAFGSSQEENVFVTIGQLWPHKRVDLAIEAVRRVENCQLYIVGQGPEEQFLRRMVQRMGLEDRVFFLHGLTNLEIQILLARALAVIFTTVREPFGIVALEAMAAGRPLLAVNEGGFTEAVDESCSFLLKPEPDLFAEKMTYLIHNKHVACDMGAAGLAKVKEFSWDRTADELLALIEDTHASWVRRHTLHHAADQDRGEVLFGIHYYGWYGKGIGSTHWNDHPAYGGVTDQPLIGYYGSSQGTTIRHHMTLLDQAGLDFLILNVHVDSDGMNPYELLTIQNVFSVAERHGSSLRFAIQLCPVNCAIGDFRDALGTLISSFCKNRRYLTHKGRPVLYFFWSGILDGQASWINLAKESAEGAVRIASCLRLYDARSERRLTMGLFDGFNLFSPLDLTDREGWHRIWRTGYDNSSAGNMNLHIFTVSPGYDDSHLTDMNRAKNPYRKIPRANGATYRAMLDYALSLNPAPDQVLISTFNEFHENTHIEPTERHGHLYLDMTKEFIKTGRNKWKRR